MGLSFFVKYSVAMFISINIINYYVAKEFANNDYGDYGGSLTQRSGNVRDAGRPKGSA